MSQSGSWEWDWVKLSSKSNEPWIEGKGTDDTESVIAAKERIISRKKSLAALEKQASSNPSDTLVRETLETSKGMLKHDMRFITEHKPSIEQLTIHENRVETLAAKQSKRIDRMAKLKAGVEKEIAEIQATYDSDSTALVEAKELVEKLKLEVQQEGEDELQEMDATSLSHPAAERSAKPSLPSTISSLSSVTTQDFLQQAMPQIQSHLTSAIDTIRAEQMAAQQAFMAQISAALGGSGFSLPPQVQQPPEPRTPVPRSSVGPPAAVNVTPGQSSPAPEGLPPIPATMLDEDNDMQDAVSSESGEESATVPGTKARKTRKSITKTAASVARKAAAAAAETGDDLL